MTIKHVPVIPPSSARRFRRLVPMQRPIYLNAFLLSTLILSFLILFVRSSSAQESIDPFGDPDSAFAVSDDEKKALLDKASEALRWYRTLTRDDRSTFPPSAYRKQIGPLELMQAAALTKQAEQIDISRNLREMLPYFQITPAECFEIEERLGDDVLASFQEERELLGAENTQDSMSRIREGSQRFLTSQLSPSEKMALIDPPTTVGQIMQAVDLLAATGRPMLTRYYLRRLLTTEASPEEYAGIVQRLGSRRLMQIAVDPKLAPQAPEAVRRIMAESKKHWTDKQVVDDAVAALESADFSGENGKLTAASQDALQALWRGDRVSVVRLIDRLGQTEDDKQADELLAAFLSLGGDAREALSESLQSDNPKLLRHAVRGLMTVLAPADVFLLYPALYAKSDLLSESQQRNVETFVRQKTGQKPDLQNAVAILYTRAVDYYERNRPLKSDSDGYVRFWNWSDEEKKAKYIRMNVPAAYRTLSLRYARQAFQLSAEDSPEYDAVKRFYLTTLFDRAAWLDGRDAAPDFDGLSNEINDLKPIELERILDSALETEHYGAAQVAATLLARQAERRIERPADAARRLLSSPDGKPRSLVRAVACPDRRVRFAALEAILSLKPDAPYPGSSLTIEALDWFSRADGRKMLVAVHPKQSEAAKTAGHFIALGYQGELATTGKDAMRLAAASPDVEMILADMHATRPTIPNLVQELRKDNRTHDIPVAVLSDDSKTLDAATNLQSTRTLPEMQRFERLSPDNPLGVSLSLIYPSAIDEDRAAWIERDLFRKTGAEPVPPEIRIRQAHAALAWLKEIVEAADSGKKIYHFEDFDGILQNALHSDVRLDPGLDLAAATRTGAAQAAIYEIVADSLYPMEIRKKAAEHFKRSIEAFGILLRGRQVQRLYDRYNAAEFESKDIQELLGSLIDLIEDKAIGEKTP